MKPLIPTMGLIAALLPMPAIAMGGAFGTSGVPTLNLQVQPSNGAVTVERSAARAEDCKRHFRSGRVRMQTRPSERRAAQKACAASAAAATQDEELVAATSPKTAEEPPMAEPSKQEPAAPQSMTGAMAAAAVVEQPGEAPAAAPPPVAAIGPAQVDAPR